MKGKEEKELTQHTMQYYTKQQLQGSGKYNSKCRIGNWNEDLEMEETVLKDYLAKRTNGTLKVDLFLKRMNKALAPVELTTVKADGYVHFGDVVQVCHATTGSTLACDIDDKSSDSREDKTHAVTASTSTDPCVRNAFKIVKYEKAKSDIFEREYDDKETLHYGQKIKLMHFPEPDEKPLYLYSKPISTTNFAKFSHFQEIALTPSDSFDSVFVVLHPDVVERSNMENTEGEKVPVGKAVVLQHCATRQNLCLMPQFKFQNDFGAEYEVCAKTLTVLGKNLTMEKITQGMVRGDLEKPELPNNFWVFISSSIQ